MNELYQEYVSHMRQYADVEYASAVLAWDKEVYCPPKGADIRAQQMATLSGIAHELFTKASFGELLDQLIAQKEELDFKIARNITITQKEYHRNQKLSTEFVIRRSRAISAAYDAWVKAREANDFAIYKEPLAALVDIKKEEAQLLSEGDNLYDALLDQYEPGATVAELDPLFNDVKEQLVAFAQKIRQQAPIPHDFLQQHFPKDQQWDFGIELLKAMGYDFEAGRQDISHHPFTINFSPNDVRVTTRIDEQNFENMTWSCIHEGGHALYEQGLPVEEYGLPSGKYISLGIHESQSRLWENNVGRALPFWKAHYPSLQKYFPDQLGTVPLDVFYRGINRIAPSLIRTEADEIHYHFHILIRYEIEKALIDGTVAVDQLDQVWNEKYKEYLDLDVPDDRQGILQDIHWSHGSIGYFPTYSLGSFYAAQFYQQAVKDIPELEQAIESGNHQPLLGWLRNHIHQYGQQYTAQQICERITGESLNFQYFMNYAEKKFGAIYKL